MIDKGYTKLTYHKMRKLMPNEFQIQDLGEHANSGMLRRGVEYGVLIKPRNGWYKVADGITDPWKAYDAVAVKIRRLGNPRGKNFKGIGSKRQLIIKPGPGPIPSHPPPLDIGPRVSVASYGQQQLIIIGKQIFLGVEVALVPKGRQNG